MQMRRKETARRPYLNRKRQGTRQSHQVCLEVPSCHFRATIAPLSRRSRGATVTRHERDSDTTPPPPPSPFSLEKNVARFLWNDGKRPQFFTGHHFKHFKINKTRATLEIFMQLEIPLAELPLEVILPPQDVAAGDVRGRAGAPKNNAKQFYNNVAK